MNILNLGIFAHVDAGKTTTVEHLLYMSGTTRKLGSVDDGSAVTDSLEIERSRGISVKSASAVINFPNLRINIIDTPGHMDFTAEVQRALIAVDCAILIVSAAEGVQSQTELFFNALCSAKIPTIIFVNKIDRAGVETDKILAEIKRTLSADVLPINAVKSQGARDCAVENRVFDDDDIFTLCSFDNTLENDFFNGVEINQIRLNNSLFHQCSKGNVYPLVYGSAACNIGIEKLAEAVKQFPVLRETEEGGVSGSVYKIEHDKAMGKVAHIRLFSGQIANRDAITLSDGNIDPRVEKITQIRRLTSASKHEDSGKLCSGDIAAVYGLSSAKIGDIVGEIFEGRNRSVLKTIPLFNVKVSDGNPNSTPLLTAIRELSEEDPLLSYEWAQDERELTIKIMGEIQIEVLQHLLSERYNIKAEFSPPTVIYKETVLKKGVGYEAYTMPKPCWACVELTFEPLPQGSGYIFESAVKGGQIPYKYQTHIKTSLNDAIKQGLYGWETTDVKITLTGGEDHFIHTHPMDFFVATPVAFMNGMVNCQSQLLEPFITAKISASEELCGRILSDITLMRGQFDSPVITNGNAEIETQLPLAAAYDYSVRLASLSFGKARYSSQFADFRPCPLELGKTATRRGINPLDRAKWILHCRQAL